MRTLAPDLKGVCTTCSYETDWVGEFEDFNAQLGVCPKCGHQLELFDNLQPEPEWLYELEAEINRRSKTYIKWVQQQLNRIESAGLRADGVMGTKTRNAIKVFQKKYSVVSPPDGKPSEKLDSFFIMFGAPPPPGSPKPKSFDPRSLPANVYAAFKQGAGAWKIVLQRALDAGITSAEKLADIMFFLAHPERKGRQINSSETQAIREWNNWRNKIRPTLKARQAVNIDNPVHGEPLNKEAIQNFVWMILDEAPSDHEWRRNLEAAKMAADLLKAAFDSITTINAPIGPGFFWNLYQRFQVENQDKPYLVRGTAIGMAYAIMDFVMLKQRAKSTLQDNKGIPLGFRQGFSSGYIEMRARLRKIASQRNPAFITLVRRLRSNKDKQLVMAHIYDALLRVFRLREALHKYPQENAMFRFCQFRYPAIKVCCGANPGCRLDL